MAFVCLGRSRPRTPPNDMASRGSHEETPPRRHLAGDTFDEDKESPVKLEKPKLQERERKSSWDENVSVSSDSLCASSDNADEVNKPMPPPSPMGRCRTLDVEVEGTAPQGQQSFGLGHPRQ